MDGVQQGGTQRTAVFIDPAMLARSSGTMQGSVPVSAFTRLLEDQPDQPDDALMAWQVRGEHDGRGRLYISLEVSGSVMLECQRCLGPLEWPVHVRNRLQIVQSESHLDDDGDDEQPEQIVGSARFDLLALIQDEVILALPYVPRHDACPDRADIADEPQEQPEDPPRRPSPFAVLGKLKKD